MPRDSKTIYLAANGLNVGIPGTLIDARETPRCKNVYIYRGLIRKRFGGAAVGASMGERILSYAVLEKDNLVHVVRIGATKAQVLNAAATTWASIANVALTGTDDSIVDVAYPEIGGSKILVYTNYTNNIRKWTGTGNDADLGGTPPKSKYLLNFAGFLLLGNVIDTGVAYRSRVQWSDEGNPEAYDPSDPASITGSEDLLEDDLELTGMSRYGAYACIHKESSIYLGYLTGDSNVFRFDRKETGAGAIAHKTILSLPTGEQIFLSRQGFRLFNGISAPLIQSSINLELIDFMNPGFVQRSWGVVVREVNECWFGIPMGSSEEADTIYKYNFLTGQVYKDEMTNVSAGIDFKKLLDSDWDDDTDTWDSDLSAWDSAMSLALNKRILWGYNTGKSVERTSSANDDGVAIDGQWESKDLTAADFEIDDPEGTLLEWQGVEVIAKGTSITVAYSTDEGATWTTVKTITLSGSYPSDDAPLMAWFRKVSSKCRFRFSNNTAGGTFDLKQFRPIAIRREARVR